MRVSFSNWKAIIINSSELLYKISNGEASKRKSEDKWSRKEILGHLIDSAIVNFNRFMSSISKEDLIFSTYNQDNWVKQQATNQRDWVELVELWKMLNLHIVELIEKIPEEKLFKTTINHNYNEICFVLVEKGEATSLHYLITDYFAHLQHHLKQIFEYQIG